MLHGPDQDHRRRAAQRRHPDLRREERGAAADDRQPPVRGHPHPRPTSRGWRTSRCSPASSAITASTCTIAGKRAGRGRAHRPDRSSRCPRRSSTRRHPTTSSRGCGRASGSSVRFSRAWARLASRFPAAARSARAPSTSSSPRSSASARRSTSRQAMSWRAPGMVCAAARSPFRRSRSAAPTPR